MKGNLVCIGLKTVILWVPAPAVNGYFENNKFVDSNLSLETHMATHDAGKTQKLKVLQDLNNTLQLHAHRLKLANRNDLYNEKPSSQPREDSASIATDYAKLQPKLANM